MRTIVCVQRRGDISADAGLADRRCVGSELCLGRPGALVGARAAGCQALRDQLHETKLTGEVSALQKQAEQAKRNNGRKPGK